MSNQFFTFFDFSTSRQLTSEFARPLQVTFQTCSEEEEGNVKLFWREIEKNHTESDL